MEKKLYTFMFDEWDAEAAFCCRAVSFAEAFSIFHRAVELYAWQGSLRRSRLVVQVCSGDEPFPRVIYDAAADEAATVAEDAELNGE